MGKCWLLLPMGGKVPNRDRPRNPPRVRLGGEDPREPGGGVFELTTVNKPTVGYYHKKEAEAAAEEYAKANPGVMVYVLESVEVYETLIPKVVKKNFNDDGELLPMKAIGIDTEDHTL